MFNGPMPPTTAALTTLLAATVGSLKPYQLDQVIAALATQKNARQADDLAGANEPTLTTILTNYA